MGDPYQSYIGKVVLVMADKKAYLGKAVGNDEVFLNLEKAGVTIYNQLYMAIREYKSMSEGPEALPALDVKKEKIEAISCIDDLV